MSNFSFKTIDVPAAAGTYEFISVDGVDPAGEAVGNYGNTDGDGDSTFHGLTALAAGNGVNFDPPGSSNTDVVGITSSGEIFGDYTDFANRQYGFVDNNGAVTQISIFLANSTTVNGVNDEGVIYGEYADFADSVHGFIDTNGTIAQVDVPGALSTVISGVNASGVIAGTYTDATGVGAHGFVDTNGSFKTIDPAGSIFTSVVGISDAGLVVGNWEDSSNTQHSFIYNNGVITTINIPGATSSGISAINASGEIVGYYTDSIGNVHGFIDENGVVVTVDIPGARETNILGVNALGEISGYYNDSSYVQHGFIGTPASTVIQTDGSTSLAQVGFGYFLDPAGGGTGPYLQYGGTAVTTGEFGAWVPIGAVQISGGDYEVVWSLPGGNQYSIWTTDSSGNLVSQLSGLTGNSYALEAAESVLGQDLNGDGTIGLVQTLIHTDGSTSLTEVAQNYFLYDGGVGPELQYGGAPVTVGEFGAWTPIGAIQISGGGYEVVYSFPGGNQYSIWTTDSAGHFVSQLSGLTGTSYALEAAESVLGQDLNGDGMIGLVQTLIHTDGSTSLTEVAQNYFLYDGGVGPELQYGGAPVTVGEFGAWAPIGAIQISGGDYEVVFSLPGGNQYSIWTTDSAGNFVSQVSGLTGTSFALEAAESVLGQDLNGDGTIGLVKTLIQTDGSTSLTQVLQNYFLYNGGVGPELQYGGAPVTVGEFGAWAPIGAIQISGGYEVVYALPGGNQYSIWTTDSSGNFVSQVSGLTGASQALEAAESVLGQDLNGDGVIGASATIASGASLELHAADSVAVHFNGPTGTLILDHSIGFTGQISNLTGNGSLSGSDQIDLKDIAFGTGTTVAYSGNSTGGTLTVSDAEGHTANIALAGNYTGSTFALSSDGSGGTIVIDPPLQQASGGGSAGFNFNFDSTPASGTAGTPPATVTVAGSGNDAFVFHPGFGAEVIVHAASSDTIELDGFSSITSGKQLASLLAEAQAGQPQSVFHSANGGHDTVINLDNHDSITLANFHLADLHAGNFIIH